ncbi:MAG: cobalt-precorrin-6A reductase [Pseudomonadota bacterium]
MAHNLLILGGTTEASRLGQAVAEAGLRGQVSLAGRVARPKRQPLPMRVGGFGGVAGLIGFLRTEKISHIIDATHPFASQMSHNAARAAQETGLPLVAFTRPPWQPGPGDDWVCVPDIDAAARSLDGPAERIMLAVGRMHLSTFAISPQHDYLLRLVDPPDGPLPLPRCQVVLDRGPFTLAGDLALMRAHGIQRVISKNAGGTAAIAKLEAARELGLPVTMIERPRQPQRTEITRLEDVMAWITQTGITHSGTERGV